jgi:hypothetical protein
MDIQRTNRTIGQGMIEMPEDRRLAVIRFSRKTLIVIVAIVAAYAAGYLAGRSDGQNNMMKYWLEKTAPKSAAR